MKKILIYVTILTGVILASCTPTVNREQEEQNQKAKYPIIAFVEDFVASHPNFDNNEITRTKADEDFVEAFRSASDSINLIAGIPVKLEALQENSKGEVMAQFQSWIQPHNFDFPHPLNRVYFDIVGKIDPKYVTSLNEETYYTIHGKFVERIENLYAFRALLGRSSSIYTPQFNVRKGEIFDDKFDVSLGMMYFDIDSISTFNQ